MISIGLADSVRADLKEIGNLLNQKARQYHAYNNDLENFSKGALLVYGNSEKEKLFETAKGYMLKHVSMLYSQCAFQKPKIDESLLDIAIYCLIMRYILTLEEETTR